MYCDTFEFYVFVPGGGVGGGAANPLTNKATVVTTYATNKALTTASAMPVPSSPTGSGACGGPGNPHTLPDE